MVRSFYPILDSEPLADEHSIKLSSFMKKNFELISRLVDRAEQLSLDIQELSPSFVLCHSDLHAGNILIDSNDKLYIVDWDEPIMAPKERDLMFFGGGVGNVWNQPHEETLFYKAYDDVEINPALLAYYRHERILEDIAEYCDNLLLTPAGGANRQEMYNHFVDMFESNGVVDIALKMQLS